MATSKDISQRYGFTHSVICSSCKSIIFDKKRMEIMDDHMRSRFSSLDESLRCCNAPFTLHYRKRKEDLYEWYGGLRNRKGNLMVMGLEWKNDNNDRRKL